MAEVTAARAVPMMREMRIKRSPLERLEYIIIVSTLLLLVVVTVQPILNLLAISFSQPSRVPGMSGLAVVPDGFSLEVWQLLLQHPLVQRGLLNSIWITAASTLLGVLGTALMAWGLSRPNLPGRRLLFIFVLVTIVFEPGIIPDYFLMKRMGLLNDQWSVILFKVINAWYLIILVRFFEEIPNELLEAAELDGLLQRAGLDVVGGTTLYRLVRHPLARHLHAHLACHHIWVRRFDWNDSLLRFGLPPDDQARLRLGAALADGLAAAHVGDHGTRTG